MDGAEVALSALLIVGTLCGALIWLLKKLFAQNENVLTRLATSLDGLAELLKSQQENEEERRREHEEFKAELVRMFTQIDEKQDRNYNALSTLNVKELNVETVIRK